MSYLLIQRIVESLSFRLLVIFTRKVHLRHSKQRKTIHQSQLLKFRLGSDIFCLSFPSPATYERPWSHTLINYGRPWSHTLINHGRPWSHTLINYGRPWSHTLIIMAIFYNSPWKWMLLEKHLCWKLKNKFCHSSTSSTVPYKYI